MTPRVQATQYHLHTPGPAMLPPDVARALSVQTLDHRGPEFGAIVSRVREGLSRLAQSDAARVFVFGSGGTGGWEAALTNLIVPGETILVASTGHFSEQWALLAEHHGYTVYKTPLDLRRGADIEAIGTALADDSTHAIRAVLVVHNETSTGTVTDVQAVGGLIRELNHPAYLIVDAISSLGCMTYAHDSWGVDVTISCSQKGLMSPPGIGINIVSDRALRESQNAKTMTHYWSWARMLARYDEDQFPNTPPTNLFFALDAALNRIEAEGYDSVYRRHQRLATAARAAVRSWGFETQCQIDADASPSVTAVRCPQSVDADAVINAAHDCYGLVLGRGLGKLKQDVFRIGHLGYIDEYSLLGALATLELSIGRTGNTITGSGVSAAVSALRA